MNEQDLRVRKTKRALVNAMMNMLRHRSFTSVTIKGLCDESLINRATFYKHYQNKDDLLYDMLNSLTVDSHTISARALLTKPFTTSPMVITEPLGEIITKQQTDLKFYGVYRQFFYNYYMNLFKSIQFNRTIPKPLIAYTLVNNIFSFMAWQKDFQLHSSADEMDRLYNEMFKMSDICKD
ncbi:TetR/AcrR family transcriptional regulator [Furfurilactobacillus milii]|uniref:TetR family transcriptional regulator n=1 Tax=Furfurilactobacillus milii TaxID=2888272 RepID=A0A6N9I4B4_9LACO|nr:TetR/AcrR family transcriptional regulator [Furfurilactobacillus milii]MYV17637.1 TetR family transcriptional regulator [Furfurilactobacillus milii]